MAWASWASSTLHAFDATRGMYVPAASPFARAPDAPPFPHVYLGAAIASYGPRRCMSPTSDAARME